MDRGDFIIAVFLVVCEHYRAIKKQYRIRRGGFAPSLTDEEVITMEICGEYFKLGCDKDLFAYFHTHYLHFFPKLIERSIFVRQAANLWQIKAAIQKRLVEVSGQAHDPVQVIDTLPLPVCVLTRAMRDHCFKTEADFGYCAAKDMRYYGFKLGLRISRLGMITHYPLLAARPHDIQSLETFWKVSKVWFQQTKALLMNIGTSSYWSDTKLPLLRLLEKICKRVCQPIFCSFANGSGNLSKPLALI